MEGRGPAARFKGKGLEYRFPLLATKLEWKARHQTAVILFRTMESSNINAKNQSKDPSSPAICL